MLLLFFSLFTYSFQTKVIQGEVCSVNWFYTGMQGIDLSASSKGDLFVIGTDNKIYSYNFISSKYELISAPTELMSPNSITVDERGRPFVVANCGNIYYYYNNDWIKLPGCANDISVGKNGEIWKIGCEKQIYDGYDISKMVCEYKKEMLTDFYSVIETDGDNEDIKNQIEKYCHWTTIDGEGHRIAVSPEGTPYIIAPGNVIMKYEEDEWVGIYGHLAIDLDVSNEGILFIVGIDGIILRNISEELGTWQELAGRADRISVGPYSHPAIISNIGKHVKISVEIIHNQ